MIGKILIGITLIFIIIQFIRPAKNNSGDKPADISKMYAVPDSVNAILQRSCKDCHSNSTEYPWYASIEPVGWWLSSHIKDGKRHFNLNNFSSVRVAIQKKKMEEVMEQLRDDDMPLRTYTLIHKDAELSAADKQTLNNWCLKIIEQIKADNPPDSLILKNDKRH
jgi:hypothetical protein